jgi:hypothetical protein
MASASRDDALAGLGVLASGGERLTQLNTPAFIEQQGQSGGFWMSYHELTNDYPWLCKRIAHVSVAGGAEAANHAAPRRHILAWFIAAMTPRLGIAGGGGSMLVMIVIIAGIRRHLRKSACRSRLRTARSARSVLSAGTCAPAVRGQEFLPGTDR